MEPSGRPATASSIGAPDGGASNGSVRLCEVDIVALSKTRVPNGPRTGHSRGGQGGPRRNNDG